MKYLCTLTPLLLLLLTISALSVAKESVSIIKIQNVMGRCLTAAGVNANRTNVEIFDCNKPNSQEWFLYSGGEIRSGYGRCLDVAGGVNANRTNVQIFDCNGSKSQKWLVNSAGQIRNVLGRCLDVAGGVNADGTNVQLFDCNNTKSQEWRLRRDHRGKKPNRSAPKAPRECCPPGSGFDPDKCDC